MKRIALLVLVFAAAAIAEDDIKQLAEQFETQEETVNMCLDETESTVEEVYATRKLMEQIEDDNFDDEAKKALEKHGSFLACMFEKTEMMTDAKLEVDKLLESLEKEKEVYQIDKDALKECLIALNEDNDLGREQRAMGSIVCFAVSKEEDKKK